MQSKLAYLESENTQLTEQVKTLTAQVYTY